MTTPAEQASERAIPRAISLAPSWRATAKFLRAKAAHCPHTEAVSDCAHCNFTYAAITLEELADGKYEAAVLARAERAEAALQLLARLAADTPQFDNPLHIYEAKRIRDAILEGRKP
jgi:hypothetical protein